MAFNGFNEITQSGTWGSDAGGRGSGGLQSWGVSTPMGRGWGQEEKAEATREWGEKVAGLRHREHTMTKAHDLEPDCLTCSNGVMDTGEI